jgi:ABC-2 type transport system ATP-binding protein
LTAILADAGARVAAEPNGDLAVGDLDAAGIGDLAARHGIPIHHVTTRGASLEEAYLALTADSVRYPARVDAAAAR